MLNFGLLAAFDVNRLQGAFFSASQSGWWCAWGCFNPPSNVISVIFRSYGSLGCERHLSCLQRVKRASSCGVFFLLLLAMSCLGGSAMERTVIPNHAFSCTYDATVHYWEIMSLARAVGDRLFCHHPLPEEIVGSRKTSCMYRHTCWGSEGGQERWGPVWEFACIIHNWKV